MRKAFGIVRVSQSKGKEGESFISPEDQRRRIEETCGRLDLQLIDTEPEIDVSGATPLERRDGLREAVEAIEGGRAQVLVVGYFDRLVRSIRVQGEVVSRVEAAGGEVLAVDYGRITEETAVQWLSGTLIGAVHEYVRRSTMEKSAAAQADAVSRGVVPFGQVPPGLALGEDNRIVHTDELPIVVEAFELRDQGATVKEVRAFLGERGIERSYHGVTTMLGSRLYLGEIHFGKLVNLRAHASAIDRDLFNRVQKRRVSRGRRAKSERILARLGVLYCEEGARMTVGTQTQNGRSYPFYRCPTTGDCEHRMTIGAAIAENLVVAETKRIANELEGKASAEEEAQADQRAAEQAQADLDAAIRAFAGVAGEAAAIERIAELTRVRDAADAKAAHSGHLHSALAVSVADWDDLSLDARRSLIAATIDRAVVGREGKGAARITVHPFGQ